MKNNIIIALLFVSIITVSIYVAVSIFTKRELETVADYIKSAEGFKNGRVTFVELGAKECGPCIEMEPIIEKIKTDYGNRINIVTFDIWKAPKIGQVFNVRIIPTQVFYDENLQEQFRHVGFWSEEKIKTQIDKLITK